MAWLLSGYMVIFFAYFILPTFLNPYHELLFFHDFPVLQPLGADLVEYLKFSRAWVETGSPYILSNIYPPFQAIFFWRFMLSGSGQSYIYMTVLSFLSYLAIAVGYPLITSDYRKLNSPAIFGILTGLFSYGFWFELERGQFDLLCMAICYLGIYIFHRHPRFRLAAYLLFIISVNLKIYPLIFIICFTSDLHAWKQNIRRWALLLMANFAGLLILGWKGFLEFVHSLTGQLGQPTYWWIGNHSIDSFTRILVEKFKGINPGLYVTLKENIFWLSMVWMVVYLLCLGVVLWIAYHRRMRADNPYILLIVTLGALLLPSTSHDYKLCILVPAIIVFFNNMDLSRSGKTFLDLVAVILVILISICYSATLFLHINLPLLLASNFPSLMVLAVATALLLWVQTARSRGIEDRARLPDPT